MRLLDIYKPFSVKLVDDIQRDQHTAEVPYAIISHRWYPNELKYEEMAALEKNAHNRPQGKDASIEKVQGACTASARWSQRRNAGRQKLVPVNHVWLDTVCINKSDPSELSESINSMYRWYEEATVCFVYLHDHTDGHNTLSTSDWFTRGWTLQELVAPPDLEFYDRNWKFIGNKESLKDEISRLTGIASDIFSRGQSRVSIQNASISHRMSWFSQRSTTKGEDEAYSLMGLFEVYMPAIYGEGKERAFRRLQEEIMKYSDDQTLFAWADTRPGQDKNDANMAGCGLLAPSPYCFALSGNYKHEEMARMSNPSAEPFSFTNQGLSISLHLFNYKSNIYIASLDFLIDLQHHVGIYLKRISSAGEHYQRIYPWKLCQVKIGGRGERKRIYIRQKSQY